MTTTGGPVRVDDFVDLVVRLRAELQVLTELLERVVAIAIGGWSPAFRTMVNGLLNDLVRYWKQSAHTVAIRPGEVS